MSVVVSVSMADWGSTSEVTVGKGEVDIVCSGERGATASSFFGGTSEQTDDGEDGGTEWTGWDGRWGGQADEDSAGSAERTDGEVKT